MKTLTLKGSTKEQATYLIPRNEPIDALDWLRVSVDYKNGELNIKKVNGYYPNFSEWDINSKPAHVSGVLSNFLLKDVIDKHDSKPLAGHMEAIGQKIVGYVGFLQKAQQAGDLKEAILLSNPDRLITLVKGQIELGENEFEKFKKLFADDFLAMSDIIRAQTEQDSLVKESISEETLQLMAEIEARFKGAFARTA